MSDMTRREFAALVGAVGLLFAVKVRRARAQQSRMPVVGFLNSASPDGYVPMVAAFRQGLKEGGYLEAPHFTGPATSVVQKNVIDDAIL